MMSCVDIFLLSPQAWIGAEITGVIPAERSESRDPTLSACRRGEMGPGSALRTVRDDSFRLARMYERGGGG